MAFQGTITPRGQIDKLAEIDGSKIVGTKVHAPFAINPHVYVLPMDNVLPTKVKFLLALNYSLIYNRFREPVLSHPSPPILLTISKPTLIFVKNLNFTKSMHLGWLSTSFL